MVMQMSCKDSRLHMHDLTNFKPDYSGFANVANKHVVPFDSVNIMVYFDT